MQKNIYFIVLWFFFCSISFSQLVQEGNKLIGSGTTGAGQGVAVSLSGDGNTAIVGGYNDDNHKGAAWIFIRTNGAWIQQGNKLVDSNSVQNSYMGSRVVISEDGNTAAIMGWVDPTASASVACVFIRNNGVWTQQGRVFGDTTQFLSLAISAEGNTIIMGAHNDTSSCAACVFTRSNGIWELQGKLVGTGSDFIGSAYGSNVGISADGNTAVIANPNDGIVGASWIFTRTNGVWSQQGDKLIGTNCSNYGAQGESVSISSDGNTIAVGGPWDEKGALWIFTREAGVWTQQGEKLVSNDPNHTFLLGSSVSISSDGKSIITGGGFDNDHGGAWLFEWNNGVWQQQGNSLTVSDAGQSNSSGWLYNVGISADAKTVVIGNEFDDDSKGAAWIFKQSISGIVNNNLINDANDFSLSQNYPNPFNPTTIINYSLTKEGNVNLCVYDMLGNKIATVVNEYKTAGNYSAKFNGTNLASGIYFYRLETNRYSLTKKLSLLK